MSRGSTAKILMIADFYPEAGLDGQGRYALDILRAILGAGCEVRYLIVHRSYLFLPSISPEFNGIFDFAPIDANFVVNYVYALVPRKLRSLLHRLRKMAFSRNSQPQSLQPTPSMSHFEFSPRKRRWLKRKCQSFSPSAVLVHRVNLLPVLDIVAVDGLATLKVLIMYDFLYNRKASCDRAAVTESHVIDWSLDTELAAFRRFDLLVAIQKDEAETVRGFLPQSRVIVVPAAKASVNSVQSPSEGEGCLFVGSDAEHNALGLEWFLDTVWPTVVSQVPSAHLRVAGNVCNRFRFATYRNVSFLGRVEELTSEYQRAAVCIVPLRHGSGLKIKLIDTLAHGRSSVTTAIGLQGLSEIDGQCVLRGDTSEEFSAQLIKLLTNTELRHTLERNAYSYASQELSLEKCCQPLINILLEESAY